MRAFTLPGWRRSHRTQGGGSGVEAQGKTVVVVAVAGVATGLIAGSNELRVDACGRSKGQGAREVQGARFQGARCAP
jgi:hypothetical protein